MFDLVKRPGAFNLKEVLVHNRSGVTGDGPVSVTTPPDRWAYAASFSLHDDPLDPLESHARLLIRMDATVEEGEIGIAAADPDTGDSISKEDRKAASGPTTFEILLNSPRPGVWLVIRNTAPGGVMSRVKIHEINAYLADVAQFEHTETDASQAAQRAEHSTDVISVTEIWLDVGAHLGEETFPVAADNPRIRVFAFEPNLRVASRMMGQLANFVVLPIAISEQDGRSPFYINRYSASSSLLPLVPEGLEQWVGGETLEVEETITVPTMRLDTFLNQAGIAQVDYLKIDTQGTDLGVLRSAGARLGDIQRIKLEVQITEIPLYRDACRKEEVISFLSDAGFELISSEKQTYDQEENLTFVQRVR